MPELDLAPIKARMEEATPGPWENDSLGEVGQHWSRPEPWNEVVGSVCSICGCRSDEAGVLRQEDAEFITHARTEFPCPTLRALDEDES